MRPLYDALVRRLVALVTGAEAGTRVIVGITGAPGAGKSSVARGLLERLGAPAPEGLGPDAARLVPMDGFHLADRQLERLGLTDRKGAPETFDADGYVALLRRLLEERGQTVYAPGFERDLEQPIAAAIAVEPSVRLVITEGNYLLLPQEPWVSVRSLLAEVWFVDIDDATRVGRLVARHERFGKSPQAAREWVLRSDEANARLVAATRGCADLVVST
ncbi:MAG: nucleoside/nucleotide kinase family protein [Intrasporangium sp.]|uniref:nucleoside/nucleotide kinase family protein n=1 Tax=Intrasporangium sp. TaxID=1925024 RepID=UPI002648B173|nr:nucleoside/nucleotide kinase family protein [Intrasporangium sp.]MDN5798088.1 nucleoside/nucleotide kinase family protein [Intrasporangium sp.]